MIDSIVKSLLVIGLLCGCLTASGQAKPGFYLTMDMDMELCDHKMKMLKVKSVHCLSEEPIIEFDLVERVDELVYDSLLEMRKFRIVLSKKAADYVSTVATKLPGHNLALVVNGILVSIIDLEGIYNARSIIIWDLHDSQVIDWVHRSLVKEVDKHSKKS